MINTYKDLYLPVPDAQVARALTGPKGPAQYKIKDKDKVSENFLKNVVAPHTFALLGSKVATMLAKALLFAVCNGLHLVPCNVVTRVKRAMEAMEMPINVNPIDRFPIAILNNGGDLRIKPMVRANAPLSQPTDHTVAAPTQYVLPLQNGLADLMAMMAAMQHCHKETMAAILAAFSQQSTKMMDQMLRVLANQQRIMLAPPFWRALPLLSRLPCGTNRPPLPPVLQQAGPPAKLKSRPGNLYNLWREYTHGLDGNKPVQLFTAADKGKVACTYRWRYAFWRVISNMVCSGLTAKMAIERVYMAYGHGTSMSEILKAMAKDKKLPGGARPKLVV